MVTDFHKTSSPRTPLVNLLFPALLCQNSAEPLLRVFSLHQSLCGSVSESQLQRIVRTAEKLRGQ